MSSNSLQLEQLAYSPGLPQEGLGILPRLLQASPAHVQVVSCSSGNLPHPHQLPNNLWLPPAVSMCCHLLHLVLPILGFLAPSTSAPHHQDPDGEIDRWGLPSLPFL